MINFSFVIKFSILLTIPCLLSCDPWSSETEEALKLAGENRAELEKVLRHYDEVEPDTLKFKAAEYLIANMSYQHSVFGAGVDSLNKNFEYLYGVFTVPLIYPGKRLG